MYAQDLTTILYFTKRNEIILWEQEKRKKKNPQKTEREKYIQLPPPPSDLFISHTA